MSSELRPGVVDSKAVWKYAQNSTWREANPISARLSLHISPRAYLANEMCIQLFHDLYPLVTGTHQIATARSPEDQQYMAPEQATMGLADYQKSNQCMIQMNAGYCMIQI